MTLEMADFFCVGVAKTMRTRIVAMMVRYMVNLYDWIDKIFRYTHYKSIKVSTVEQGLH